MKIISNYLEEGIGEARRRTAPTEECNKMAATGRRRPAAICMTDAGGLRDWRRRDVNAEGRSLSSSSKAGSERNGQTREPLSSVLGAFDYYWFIFPVNITIESCKKEIK